MPSDTAAAKEVRKPKLRNAEDKFALEPDAEPGKVPKRVIDELRRLRTAANDASTDFREAIKIQSEKRKIKPAALRRYIVALGNDRVDEVRVEAEQLETLIEAGTA
jgi:hypothetical protein